jgi:carboxypeptidase D
MSSLKKTHESCGYQKFIDEHLVFPPSGFQPSANTDASCDVFNSAQSAIKRVNSCFNIYEVNQTCPTPVDQLDGSPYFDRSDVKAALHVPSDSAWSECGNGVFVGYGGPENEGDNSLDPIQHVLPQVVEATNRVLVANGDYDMIIITNGTLLSIQNMTWNGGLGFQGAPTTPINIPGQGVMGIQHFERGLMWAETYKSGHMQPEYQAKSAYRHIQWLLGHIDIL